MRKALTAWTLVLMTVLVGCRAGHPSESAHSRSAATPPEKTTHGTDPFTPATQPREKRPEQISNSFFLDRHQGWIIDSSTELFATTDGGLTWTKLSTFESRVNQVFFLTALRGWAVSADSLLSTEDGGRSWTPVDLSGVERLLRVQFLDESYAVGTYADDTYRFLLARSDDGGRAWEPLDTPCTGQVNAYWFTDRATGWIVCGVKAVGLGGQVKQVLQTSDGGNLWSVIAETGPEGEFTPSGLPGAGYVTSMFFLDPMHGWIGGGRYGGLWVTRDGGRTWKSTATSPSEMTVTDIRFFSPDEGVVLAWRESGPGLMLTSDGGATWQELGIK